MSNQILISSGAKLRDLDDVIIGTDGVLSSLGFNVANGVPKLDENGKILVSQLPNSVMEFKGVWNAATNTPTLTDGVGNAGDVYLCNVAGTVNFGTGPITFAVGDYAVYTGTVWARSSGATGTVTSVAVSKDGDALAITGSPITTSGTINIGFTGTNLQYINGAGNLVTFPTLTGYVPYTGATQNVDLGTYGLLGDFIGFNTTPSSVPTTLGTLSWDSFYKTLQVVTGDGDTTLQIGQEQVTLVHNNTGSTLTDGQVVYVTGSTGELPTVALASNATEATSSVTFGVVTESIPHGGEGFITTSGIVHGLNTLAFTEGDAIWLGATAGTFTNVKPIAPANSVLVGYVIKRAGGNGSIFVKIQNGYELYELHDVLITSVADGDILQWNSATSLWENVAGTTTNIAEGTNQYFTNARARAAISLTTTGSTGAATYDNSTGVLNIPQYVDQYVGTVTSVGLSAPTGFSVSGSPVTSSGTLALSFASGYSLPTNVKQSNWDDAYTWVAAFPTQTGNAGKFLTTDGSTLSWATVIAGVQSVTASSPLFSSGGANPNITIQVATTSQNGYLSSTDWNTFNGKQNALTNPVTGTGTNNYVSKFTTTGSTIGNSQIFDNGTNVGINTINPFAIADTNLSVNGSGSSAIQLGIGDTRIGQFFASSSEVRFGSITNVPLRFYTNDAEAMRIFSDSNVGINTGATNAGYKLDVNGTGRFSGLLTVSTSLNAEPYGQAYFYSTVTNGVGGIIVGGEDQAHIRFLAGSQTWTGAGAKKWQIRGRKEDYLAIYSFTKTDDIITFFSTGNISIGNTSNAYKLDVTGNLNVNYDGQTALFQGGSRYLQINVRNTPNSGDFGVALRTSTGSYLSLAAGQNTTTGLVINEQGNLGVRAAANTSWTNNAKVLQLGDYPVIYADGSGAENLILSSNSYYNGSNNIYTTSRATTRTVYESSTPTITHQVATSGTAGTTVSYQSIGVFDTTGFGIKTAPITLFHTYSSTDNFTTLEAGSSSGIQIRFKHGSSQTGFINSNTTNIFSVYQGTGTEKLSLGSNGQLNYYHIGDAPISNDLYGNIIVNSNGSAYFSRIRFDVSTTAYWGLTRIASSNDFSISGRIGSSWSDNVFRIYQSTGNVAIGSTVSGGGALQVNGNVNINGVFQINGVTIGGGGGSGVTGSGTTNYLPKWSSSSSLGNSLIYDNGTQVTIGGTTGGSKLNVFGTADSTFYAQLQVKGTGSYPDTLTGILINAGTAQGHLRFAVADTLKYQIRYNEGSTANDYLGFYSFVTNSTQMIINASNGNILINTSTDNGYKLQINGSASFAYGFLSIYRGSSSPNDILVGNDGSRFYIGGNTYVAGSVTATGGFFDTSDARLKTLVEDNYLLSSIANVKAKLYKKDGRMELGYYAQDLKEILPSAVSEGSDGFLSLSYAQVHTAKIAVIEDEVTMLKNRVSELEKQLNLN